MDEYPHSRLIGYARVSTDDQDLALQREALVRYGVKPEFIFEEHASGGKMNRQKLQWALKSMRRGDTIVVWKLDRLGRTVSGIIEVVAQMEEEGVHFVSLTENIDTKSPFGTMVFHVCAAFAQLERDLNSERTKAGMAVARARGAVFGQPFAITKTAKRRAEAKKIIEEGAEHITAAEALARINAADKGVKPIKTPVTWGRWLKAGCPGLEE